MEAFIYFVKNDFPQNTQNTQSDEVLGQALPIEHEDEPEHEDELPMPSDAGVTEVTRSDAEVTQAALQIKGLRGLIRLDSLAFLRNARRSSRRRSAECGIMGRRSQGNESQRNGKRSQPGKLSARRRKGPARYGGYPEREVS